jgi:nucleoside-diphosphate-sugar epimerase
VIPAEDALIFVAGGAGMAGSAIVEALIKRRPHGRVRATYRATAPRFIDERVENVRLDLTDGPTLTAALHGCDAAILAASESGGIGMLTSEPWRQVKPNLVMIATWLEALHDAGVRRAVFVGSATVYQPFDGAIEEDQLDWNQDPSPEAFGIGWVMRTAEKLCEFWRRTSRLEIVRVRAANIYGPRARFDPARSNFIPALIRKAAERRDPFEVWGSPDVTRDVVYSADFGEAIARLLEAPATNGQVFNVGSGRGLRVGDVVETLRRVAGCEHSRVVYTAAGPTSSRSRVLNCDRLFDTIRWLPSTSIEQGIRETLSWWRANRTTWPR